MRPFAPSLVVAAWLWTAMSQALAVTITQQPVSGGLSAGETRVLTIAATGVGALSYQWFRDGRVMAGEVQPQLTVGVPLDADGDFYHCVVTDDQGAVRSHLARVVLRGRLVVWTESRAFDANAASQTELLSFVKGAANEVITVNGTISTISIAVQSPGVLKATLTPLSLAQGIPCVAAVVRGYGDRALLGVDGNVRVLGSNGAALPLPAGLNNVVDVDECPSGYCALLADGSVIAWNSQTGALQSPPAAMTPVARIAGSSTHMMALREDGSVVVWEPVPGVLSSIPSNLGVVEEIAASLSVCLVRNAAGGVIGWGDQSRYVLPVPTLAQPAARLFVASNSAAYAVAADGRVMSWTDSISFEKGEERAENARHLLDARKLTNYGSSSGVTEAFAGLLADHAPEFVSEPQDVEIRTGEEMVLACEVSASPMSALQWYKDGQIISGATGTHLVIAAAQVADSGAYTVTATNIHGAVTSAQALVTVVAAPVITSAPMPATVAEGATVTFSVQASGETGLSYQWMRNGREIAGATGAQHLVGGVDEATADVYAVRVTDTAGRRRTALARAANPLGMIVWKEGVIYNTTYPASVLPVAFSEGEPSSAVGAGGECMMVHTGGGRLVAHAPEEHPAGMGVVVSIAREGNRTLALQNDGRVFAWEEAEYPNYTSYGWPASRPRPVVWRWDRGYWISERNPSRPVPRDARDVIAVSIGAGGQALALRVDGSVIGWDFKTGTPLSLPAGLADITAISSGKEHHLALRGDGTVISWGGNTYGQRDVPAGLADVRAIAAGSAISLGLKSDGSIVQWGAQKAGPSGGFLPPEVWTPYPPPAGAFRRVHHSAFAITPSGEILGWQPFGPSPSGTLPMYLPLPPTLGEAREVAACFTYLPLGGLLSNYMFALSLARTPTIQEHPRAQIVQAGDMVRLTVIADGCPRPTYQWYKGSVAIANAKSAEYVITSFQSSQAGSYNVVVTNPAGSITSDPATLTLNPGPVISVQPQPLALHPGLGGVLSVTASGTGMLSQQWYRNGRPISGATGGSLAIGADPVAAAGVYHVIVTDDSGSSLTRMVRVGQGCSLTGWQDGATTPFEENYTYPPADVFLALSEGEAKLALAANGNMAWQYQGVSDPWFMFYPTPMSFPGQGTYSTQPAADSAFVSAFARGQIGVALAANGRVAAWESRTETQCYVLTVVGATTTTCHPYASRREFLVPGSAHGAVAVSLSESGEALALKQDGSVVAWDARWSLLRAVPGAASAGVMAISSGVDHHLALKSDGSVFAWGDNSSGECDVPAGLPAVKAITAGENASFAIHEDGSVSAWGSNVDNQITVPAGLLGVTSIRAVQGSVLAMQADGGVVAWGLMHEASDVPAGLGQVYDVGVLPVPPLSPYSIWNGVMSGGSYGLALVPARGPSYRFDFLTRRVFPGYTGNTHTVNVTSFPGGPYTGAWMKDGTQITTPVTFQFGYQYLSITNATLADAGQYRFSASNAWQATVSQAATLEVVPPRLLSDWQSAHFTSAEIAGGLHLPGADPDGRGIPNLLRYAFGLDPRNPPAGGLPQVSFVPTPVPPSLPPGYSYTELGTLSLSFAVPRDTADVIFRLQGSPDLSTWSDVNSFPALGQVTGDLRSASFSVKIETQTPGGAPPNRFFRIAVEQTAPAPQPRF